MDGRIRPVCKLSSTKVLQASTSWGFSGYSLATFGMNELVRSMAWSKLQRGGRVLNICSPNMSAYSEYWGGRTTSSFVAAIASSVERVVFQMCSSGNEMVLVAQSIWGLFFVSHGIPSTTCAHPSPTIIRVKSSSKAEALQWTLVVAMIRPCLLTVPSTLKACRGWMGQDRRRRRWTREGSMKFPVAPQSIRAVVTSVLVLYCSRMGNQIARSD